jgi:tetratricopeptide (TPR) repeat protein
LRDSVTVAERELGRPLARAEVSQYWSEKARTWIRSHRREWLALMGRKFANFWNAFQYDDLSMVPQLKAEGVLLPGLRFGVIAALALPGMLLAAWRNPRLRWVAGAIVLHLAALLPVFITERYRMCAVPGLAIFAAYGVAHVWSELIERRWREPVSYGLLAAAAAFFVSSPRSNAGLWSLDHYNRGLRAQKNGEIDLAQEQLELAHAYVPDNAEINFGLGTFWHEQGNHQKAKAFYRRALQLNPAHPNAWNNLGVIALEEKFFPTAKRCFELSLQAEPEDAKTHYLLARTLMEMDDRPAARVAVKKALELQPERHEFKALADQLSDP